MIRATFTLTLFATAALSDSPRDDETRVPESTFLTNTRQLIFDGRRAGEGYFSADGSLLVFQSEREADNPFYQIYLMDLETGDVERVSPGSGKTTCAWIHPDNQRVLYASTQDDPEAVAKQKKEFEDRNSGRERRYAWDYDSTFDLYAWNRKTHDYSRLTDTTGYDAEGSYSPDGNLIAFASNRAAYADNLPEKEAEHRDTDPSYFNDIYIMNADGNNVRQLTKTPGYDGGPFFSPDGKRICWRRFSEDGATAEVFTMNIDGSDVRQLTHLGAMSWAPYYHPSGEYLIFTTNKHGFANFELYVVSADGGTPVRITTTDGFDGLPVFTPDGKRLAWTSTRTTDKKAQIFIADWNHQNAQTALKDATPKQAVSDNNIRSTVDRVAPAGDLSQAIEVAELKAHVAALASEEFEGRLTGTEGELLATHYVAREFERIGLAPDGDNGSWYQQFEFTAGVSLGEDNKLSATLPKSADTESLSFAVDSNWRPLAFSEVGAVDTTEVVFVGYGIVAPKVDEFEARDAYDGLDVSGKWVLALRFLPPMLADDARQHLQRYSSLRYKAMVARDKGAAGIIIVTGPQEKVKEQLVPLAYDASIARTSIAAISIADDVANHMFQVSGHSLTEAANAADSAKSPEELASLLRDVRLSANIDIDTKKCNGRNVLARLRAADAPLGAPPLIIGAHVDHLGRGKGSNSLARDDEADGIHYGADDNASGIAALIEVAEYLKHRVAGGKLKLKRDVVFAAWSGEELGLIGSKYYVDEIAKTAQSAGDLHEKVAAYLNMDMVGRLEKSLILAGVGSSPSWAREIEQRNAVIGLPVAIQEDGYMPTDSTSFYLKNVPILSAFTGAHSEYHTPRDKPETLNYEGMEKISRFVALVAQSLASSEEIPEFVAPKTSQPRGERANLRAYLGTIPDYAPADKPGLMLSGVATGGPAHQAGV
ncbi:MAG: M28 family peptidase, partial [Phycisphaerae bacterium]